MNKEQKAAQAFARKWAGRGEEKQESQIFWMELLQKVLGVEHPTDLVKFEERVRLSHTSFIDIMIPSTHTMIEQKSYKKELDEPIKQSDGTLLKPFEQAKRYSAALPYSERPRWIVICNFRQFDLYDMERPNDAPTRVELADFQKDYACLKVIVDRQSTRIQKEMDLSREAGTLVGKIYDALLPAYGPEPTAQDYQDLNKLIVRLVFCFYAEDADLFGKKDMFHDYLASFMPEHFRTGLMELFKVLDQKPEERDRFLEDRLKAFPYVNGSLFTETIPVPPTNEATRRLILEDGCGFDWSQISPTIFGAIFESSLNPETRRRGGMHYTSIENIHKVIDPLFLDDYKAQYEAAMQETNDKKRIQKLKELQDALASGKYFDPACGSGNFLTESYLSLRRLENDILREVLMGKSGTGVLGMDFGESTESDYIKVSIQQFYGIEINDFAVAVCKTALWIAEAQMFQETEEIIHKDMDFLPLHTNSNIHEGNALRMDWKEVVVPADNVKIMGNPPFVGARMQNDVQKKDLLSVCIDSDGEPVKRGKFLDYVSGWYFKAARYIAGTKITAAFVSTNSICQGEQVPILWENLQKNYHIHICFCYRTFVWDSEAQEKAHVHCVIIGFSAFDYPKKKIYASDIAQEDSYINGFLLNAPDCYIQRLSSPLCDVPRMSNGNRAYDGNHLILTPEEKDNLLKKDPSAQNFIKPYFMGRDLLQNKPRYVIWLYHQAPAEIRKHPLIMERVKAVREMRLNAKGASTQKAAATPTLFQTICQPTRPYLAFPRVSSQNRRYIPITFLDEDTICGDKLIIVPEATLYHFGILMSNVHNAWMRVVTGRLKSDYEYSTNIYNNFPWPRPTPAQQAKIEQTAQGILDARALYPDSSLADLYDEVLMPKELRDAHRKNDRAVMEAYGFWGRLNTESDCVAELMKMYQSLVEESEKQKR